MTGDAMTVPRLLRALAALVCLGLALDILTPPGHDTATTLEVGAGDQNRVVRALLAPEPPDRIVWRDPSDPGARAAWLLAPGPAVPALTIPPGAHPRLRVLAPTRARAGRAAALDATLRGTPDQRLTVRWTNELGTTDSVRVTLDAQGRGRVGLGVRPTREGWQEWRVTAAGDSARVGVWALPERPLRVLAWVAAPDWESRFALRALEEAGADVDARIELGRVGIDVDAPPDLTAADAVVVFGWPEPTPGIRDALTSFLASGGGIVLAGSAAGASARARTAWTSLLERWGVAAQRRPGPPLHSGDTLAWSLPATLSPLPAAPAAPAAVATESWEPAAAADAVARAVARTADGRALALVATPGRGRVAALGLVESWRWRMEAGAAAAHRAWWRGWSEWASGGLREAIVAHVDRVPPVGGTVGVGFARIDSTGALPDSVTLRRPDGRTETLAVEQEVRERGMRRYDGLLRWTRFLATEPGEYRIAWAGGETGLRISRAGPELAPSDRSLLALASGGDVVGSAEAEGAASRPWQERRERRPSPWWGALLATLLLAEWSVRRLRGGP